MFEDSAVAGDGDEDIAEAVDALAVEAGVVGHERALVVGFPESGEVVVEGAGGGNDGVEEFSAEEFFDDAAGAGGYDAGGKGEDFGAVFGVHHRVEDVDTGGNVFGAESSGCGIAVDELAEGRMVVEGEVLDWLFFHLRAPE